NRQAHLGNPDPGSDEACERELWTDHRQWESHFRPAVPARRRLRWMRHHGSRCKDWKRNLAYAHNASARRAWRRNVGRRAARPALARRYVDGSEIRSGTEPHLRWNFGDDTRAEIHPRRQRKQTPLPQLDARAERRHGKNRVVLPAPRGSLG